MKIRLEKFSDFVKIYWIVTSIVAIAAFLIVYYFG